MVSKFPVLRSEATNGFVGKYINRDKHYYWFVVSFSLLSILLHFVPSNREFHNMLYSANAVSLVGFTIMLSVYPYAFYNTYVETFRHMASYLGISRVFWQTWVNLYVFNAITWLIHLAPVLVFRNTYTLGNPLLLMIAYLLAFGIYLPKIYGGIPVVYLVLIGVSSLVIVLLRLRVISLFSYASLRSAP